MLSPAAGPDDVPDDDSVTEVPIETLADTLAADSEAVTDTAVLLLPEPAEVAAVLQLDSAEDTLSSGAADF